MMSQNKKIAKVIVAALVVIMLFGAFSGCIGGDIEQIDHAKTQVYVGNYDGGLGHQWLLKLKQRFEEAYKDYPGVDGKMGVQVMIDNDKDAYSATTLNRTIKNSEQEVFFSSGYNVEDLFIGGLTLDITDIVTEKLTAFGETRSIEDKLNPSLVNYYKRNGKYNMVPHTNSSVGVIYDLDLFNNADFGGLYFKEGSKPGDLKADRYTTFDGNRTKGPDNVKGTDDDGLPATYDEFFELCAHMKNLNITPMAWTGQHALNYTTFLLKALWADNEGIERTNIQFNAGLEEGKNVAELVVFDSNGKMVMENGKPKTELLEITPENYVEITRQPGRYYALEFWEKMVEGEYIHQMGLNLSQSHVMAQADYLESTFTDNPIAMLLEGTWWTNEATEAGTFDMLVRVHGSDAALENRNFGFFPMPKRYAAEDDEPRRATLYTELTPSFINGNIKEEKKDIAKKFLQFALSDQSLKEYTLTTGEVKALEYDISEEELNEIDSFSRNFFRTTVNSDLAYRIRYSSAADKVVTPFAQPFNYSYCNVDGVFKNRFLDAFVHDHIDARTYFEGMIDYANKVVIK